MNKLVGTLIGLLATHYFTTEAQSISINTNDVELIWTAPSNHWPATVWTYEVVAKEFAPAVVSNLMALGSFTMDDRTNIAGRPPSSDKRRIYFSNPTGTRYLGIYGLLGWVDYKDSDATVSIEDRSLATVPSDDQCYQLALDWLPKLGIDPSELATQANGSEFRTYKTVDRRGWFDKSMGTNVQEVILRGVSFIRRVDGIDFDGIGLKGGVSIKFGNDGKVSKIALVWRDLRRFRLHSTLTADQMTDAILSGDARWQPPVPNQNGIVKITVTGVTPLYRGKNGSEEQKLVEPYARISTLVDYGFTNVVANLECPISGAVEK